MSDEGKAPKAAKAKKPAKKTVETPVETVAAAPVETSQDLSRLTLETTQGPVVIKLRPDLAPNHVAHISKLVSEGFYDGIVFHRVIEGFMAQTGCPHGTGTGGSKYPNLKQEFNREPHVRGICSMARSSNPDSANSQFFICFDDATFLDRQYTVWGQVVSGMENVDKIKRGEPVRDPDKIVSAKLSIGPPHSAFGSPTYIPNPQLQQSQAQTQSSGKSMSLPAAVSTCVRKYFTVKGRAQRSEFWWFYAAYLVAVYASSFLMGISDSFSLLFLSVFVGGIIPSVTVAVRRLHDLDHSGWWYLAFYIPLVGGLLMLVWFCGRGTIGDNRFGPDPLAQDPQGIVNAQII